MRRVFCKENLLCLMAIGELSFFLSHAETGIVRVRLSE
jgi:hypothetical protein